MKQPLHTSNTVVSQPGSAVAGTDVPPLRVFHPEADADCALAEAVEPTPAARIGGHAWFLAAIPVVDSIIDQLQTIYEPSFGNLSMLQIVRGSVMVLTVFLLVLQQRLVLSQTARWFSKVLLVWGVLLTVVMVRDFATNSAFAVANVVPYVQCVYWLLLGFAASLWTRSRPEAMAVLMGIVLGAAIASGSILVMQRLGLGFQMYELQFEGGASSGGFMTGKFVAGLILCGLIGCIQFALRWRFAPVFIGLAVICLTGATVIYARAAQVAAVLCLAWPALWGIASRRNRLSTRLILLVILAALTAGAAMSLDLTKLDSRWSDLSDADKAGSGRYQFWQGAWGAFKESSMSAAVLGRGYDGMLDIMQTISGMRIHTHSDVFDLLLIGGLLGIAAWAALGLFLIRLSRSSAGTLEGALLTGVCIAYWAQGVLTGQIFGPSSMVAYLFSVVSLAVLAQSSRPRNTEEETIEPASEAQPVGHRP